jgi:flagellar FliJ protein
MGFHFSLDSVLRVRGMVEEQEERMLQRILFEIAQTLEIIERINAELTGSDALRRAEVFKPVSGFNIHASYEHVLALKEKKKELEDKLEKLEQLRDRQLVVYTGARRNREMLTEMCEQKRGVYETDAARREQRNLDDNHTSRRGRS